MTLLASDLFERADGGLGSDWTTVSVRNAPAIVGGNVVSASGIAAAFWSGALAGGGAWPADQVAEVVLGSVVSSAADEGVGPATRCSGANQIFGQCNSADTRLYVYNGSYNLLGTAAGCAAGDVIRLESVGTAHTLKKNGVAIIGPITNALLATGSAGVWATAASGPGQIASWFGYDNVTVSATLPFNSSSLRLGEYVASAFATIDGGNPRNFVAEVWEIGSGRTSLVHRSAALATAANGRLADYVADGCAAGTTYRVDLIEQVAPYRAVTFNLAAV